MNHLNNELIVSSIVDLKDLTIEEQNHLLSCSKCKDESVALKYELNQLGIMASEFAPIPLERINISTNVNQGLFIFHPAIMAFCLLIVIGIWNLSPAKLYKEYTDNIIIEQALADNDIMGVINELEVQLLSDFKVDLTDNIDDSYVNEGFMKFVVPVSIQEDSTGQLDNPVNNN
jgi:hypothetical protein